MMRGVDEGMKSIVYWGIITGVSIVVLVVGGLIVG